MRDAFPDIQQQLPSGLTGEIVYDGTEFVNSSIEEVVKTLVEALVIVTLVIFLFLGSLRAVIIPVIAMPLSLVGTFFVMLALGYSINLLTLLALVLAIGLVVDDAIIVVENVDRHMKEEHKTPLQSALLAARELGGPIIAMTVVLIAVYVPIGFQKGLTGALFTEFAFTLAGAVTVSAVVALTLSPMMCAKFFRAEQDEGRFVKFIDHQFERVQQGYKRMLHGTLATKSVVIVMAAILLLATVALGVTAQSELAPEEDQGIVAGQIVGAPNATAEQMNVYANADVRCGQEAARIRADVPAHRRAHHQPGHRWRAVQAVGASAAAARMSCSRSCRTSGTASPAPRWQRSSSRRCRAPRACRSRW